MTTIGILYPGDMGHNVARVLLEDGFSVVTSLLGRSERTQQLSAEAGVNVLDSLATVVRQADIILGIIPAPAAKLVATDVATAIHATGARPVYVDANAVSPMSAQETGEIFAPTGIPFLDASIVGPASDVRGRCTFYVSGPQAQLFANLLSSSLKTHILGDRIGQASAFKMVFSGLNKGMVCLLWELTTAAREFGCLDELLESYTTLLPGVMQALDWLVPTYPFHSARRAEEMRELAETLEHHGFSSEMARSTQQTLAAVGQAKLPERFPEYGEHGWTLRNVIEVLAQEGVLKKNS